MEYLSIPALLLASFALPLVTANSQAPEIENHRLYFPMMSVAPEKLERQWLGNIGGATGFFYVSGDIAFLVVECKIQLVDVSDPDQPVLVSEVTLPASPAQIQVQDGYAYMAMGFLGLGILDIRQPNNATIAAFLPLDGNTTHVGLSGDIAYVSNSLGLLTIDISRPENPAVISNIPMYANWSILLQNYLLVAGNGIDIFDISVPHAPVGISHYETWNGYLITVNNNRAYFAGYGCGMYNCAYWIDVVDLTDPYNPVGLATIDTDNWVPSLQVNGDIVYLVDGLYEYQLKILEFHTGGTYEQRSTYDVPGGAGWMYYENDRLYIWTSNSIEIIDVSDPDEPDSIGRFSPEQICRVIQVGLPDIYCRYDVGFDATEASGIQIMNVSDPEEMHMVGKYETGNQSYPVNHVYLDGNQLYIVSNTGAYAPAPIYGEIIELRIYDLSDPTAPQIVKQYVPSQGYGLLSGYLYDSVQIYNQIGYFITAFWDLEITDLSDPSDPKVLSTYVSNSKVVRVEEPYVYMVSPEVIADTINHTLVTLDASSLSTPTLQSSYIISETVYMEVVGGFDVSGGIAYLGLPGEVQIVDVRDPKHPASLSTLQLETLTTPTTIEVEENLALVGHDGTLEVVDVTDPSAPTILGSIHTSGWLSSIQIIGKLAYVACRDAGAQVIDLKDPSQPRLVQRYYGNTASIQTKPAFPVYLANQWDGLQIYRPYPP